MRSRAARLRSSIRAMVRRRELERTMHDEMQLHIELDEADLRASGLAPAEPRRRARAEFGSAEARKECSPRSSAASLSCWHASACTAAPAQSVISRGREIAVRMAIGARRGSVMWMVVRGTLALLVIGIVLGAGAAIASGRYIRSVLFEVTVGDPTAMIGAVGVLAAVALAASYLPVRRATRIEPAVALRAE